MGGRALVAQPEDIDVTHRKDEVQGDSPGISLLDALAAGDDAGVLAVCGDSTTVTAENMPWSCQGRDQIQRWLVEARNRFPGLTFESRTRHLGFGLVIDEARVRDVRPEGAEQATEAEPVAEHHPVAQADDESPADIHPMWDEPVTERRHAMQVWQGRIEGHDGPVDLNMPVRVTVRHDDLQVHEVLLSFPAALLKRALGMRVDPLEMSLSEVQSAFIAPVGAGFTTHTLARPELTLVPPAPPEAEDAADDETEPPRRRRGLLVTLLLALVLAAGGGAWYAVQARQATPSAQAPAPSPSPTPSAQVSATPQASPSPSATPSAARTRKPNVTLKSDLAFGFNSAQLSGAAKAAIAQVAAQVRRAGLTGKIYVDGYTDNIGSSAYGQVLSQKRADAVASVLRADLGRARVTVVAVGHGEADPIASNATPAGQAQNRRVTITLPTP